MKPSLAMLLEPVDPFVGCLAGNAEVLSKLCDGVIV